MDGGFEDLEAGEFGRELTAECGGAFFRFVACNLGGFGGRGNFDKIGFGEVA